MPNHNATHIAFLLDRSGSMHSIADDVVGGFNALVADQRETPGDCTLPLVLRQEQAEEIKKQRSKTPSA